ncbi:MAG: sigma-54-dependent transcriptional regulator [Kofleriaceae bacterium]
MADVLLVDDVPTVRLVLGRSLTDAGYRVTAVADGFEALEELRRKSFDVVISDVRMPKMDGLTLFRRIREQAPGTDVILITGQAVVADAVAAVKEGVSDYLTKPFDQDELTIKVAHIAERRALQRELAAARAQLDGTGALTGLVGRSSAILRLVERVRTMAASAAPVLVTGESGTGKELVARNLHDLGSRAANPFVAVNCAAFPEALLEAEMFGYEAGAFTGAVKRRDGRFKAADGGTLFLDEVAEIPLPAQAKLLRVLQEGTFEPLGTNQPIKVDVRIISATHRDLKQRIAEGKFRQDLYYRLNVLDITIPALRERREDLPILVEHFLRKFTPADRGPMSLSPRAWAALSQHPFPGNVRELEHAIEHAVVVAKGKSIDLEQLPIDIVGVAKRDGVVPELQTLAEAVGSFEKAYLQRALELTEGKKAKAAELLGISRKSLWEKLRAYGLGRDDEPAQ